MFAFFHDAVADPLSRLADLRRKSGRPLIGVTPAYFPLEWIHAAGGLPVSFWGERIPISRADALLPPYCCPASRSILEIELAGLTAELSGWVFTSLCDTLVNLREIFRGISPRPALAFPIPLATDPGSRRARLEERIPRVLDDLARMTGKTATAGALAAASRLYGEIRRLQRRLYEIRRGRPRLVGARDFHAAIRAGFFLDPGEYRTRLEALLPALENAPEPKGARRPRVFLSGMVSPPEEVLGLLDRLGLDAADDDFADGGRMVSRPVFSPEDPVGSLYRVLFDGRPCPCLHLPGLDRADVFPQAVREAGAQGVLFLPMRCCEPDAFERPALTARLAERGIPALALEMDFETLHPESLRTRLEAFRDLLEEADR
ncbi:MAG: 2-hydroxyacyl-CoA dehydratase family protein [Desulfobacterales bacterium]